MDRLDAMRLFLAVADRGSFVEAARSQRVSASAATRAVAQIEAELGLPLFNRTTRAVRLTERGALFADRCRHILGEVEQATRLVRGEDAAPRGVLSVTAPVLFGRLHVLPIAEALMTAHPLLEIRLTFVDRVTHLVEEGFDLAVRIGALADSALIAIPVAATRRVLVAAPAYLAAAGRPATPADLKRHRIIRFEGIDSSNDWRFGADGRTSLTVSPRLAVNSADAALASAIRGHGVTRALSYQAAEAIADGRLERLLADWEPPPVPISLVCQASRRGAPNIDAFIREARRQLRGLDWG